jgi:hypothetical protein
MEDFKSVLKLYPPAFIGDITDHLMVKTRPTSKDVTKKDKCNQMFTVTERREQGIQRVLDRNDITKTCLPFVVEKAKATSSSSTTPHLSRAWIGRVEQTLLQRSQAAA